MTDRNRALEEGGLLSVRKLFLCGLRVLCGKGMRRFCWVVVLVGLAFCQVSVAEDADIKVRISFPYENALVRANVPVFGVAWSKDFESYRLEFGPGDEPKNWVLIQESKQPQPNDPWAQGKVVWSKDWGALKGNLGVWETGLDEYPYGQKFKHNLVGPHTLRLIVRDRKGRTAEHVMHVTVARVLTNTYGGYGRSPDGVVRFDVTADGMTSAFLLVSILPTDKVKAAEDMIQLGKIYEFRPPGAEFVRPGVLSIRFTPEKPKEEPGGGPGVAMSRILIHAYDPVAERWIALPTKVDVENSVASTEILQVQRYLAYYALFKDVEAPKPPELRSLPERTHRRALRVTGKAEPHSVVDLMLGGQTVSVSCDAEGGFETQIRLKEGPNTLFASCRDQAQNASGLVQREIRLEYRHPRNVGEIRLLGAREAAYGERLLVKLTGEDASPQVDSTLVRVAASKSDPDGITIEAVETGPRTGVYVGLFEMSSATDEASAKIKALVDGEEIVAKWIVDEERQTAKGYRDRVPPGAPTISCEQQSRLCWNTFESGEDSALKQWQPLDGAFGARPALEKEGENQFGRMRGTAGKRGHLGVSPWSGSYSPVSYPVISFDFRASPQTQVDLLVHVTSPSAGWQDIRLTDDNPFFPRLGGAHGVKADGRWHHVEISLLNLLRKRFPGAQSFGVGGMAFADWDGGDRLFGTKFFGRSAHRGGYYDVDNFAIAKHGSWDRATFKWSAADDSGIEGYSYVLDKEPGSVPPEKAVSDKPEKTYEGLEEGRWWFHVRAKDKCGNWGPPNHYEFVVDRSRPKAELKSDSTVPVGFGQDIEIALTDAGAGVDPSTVDLRVDGRRCSVDGPGLSFDQGSGILAVRPHRMEPLPMGFVDGAPIGIDLAGVCDMAEFRMSWPKSWRLKAASPITVSRTDLWKRNGWCVGDPRVTIRRDEKEKWQLCWMRSLKGDKYAEKGCYIREIGLLPRPKTKSKGVGRIPIHDGKARLHLVAEVKVDKTTPKTAIAVTNLTPVEGEKQRPLITLSHSEYAFRRGGLLGRYFRKPDFTEPMLERVDPFVFFHDDREQFTPPVYGARSAIWKGAVYIPKTHTRELELAIWNRAPATGRAFIDGDLIFELKPEDMSVLGYKKQKVILTEGLHELRLEFSDPSDRMWQFALFRWGKGKRGEPVRDTFGPKELYYPENLGTTYYSWDDGPTKTYWGPFRAPSGKHVLTFWTVDQAGHVEKKQRREFTVP